MKVRIYPNCFINNRLKYLDYYVKVFSNFLSGIFIHNTGTSLNLVCNYLFWNQSYNHIIKVNRLTEKQSINLFLKIFSFVVNIENIFCT